MKNQLSKREYKYRCKIIAENHLKKDYQKYLDGQVQIKGITYKDLYFDPMRLSSILSVVAIACMIRLKFADKNYQRMPLT